MTVIEMVKDFFSGSRAEDVDGWLTAFALMALADGVVRDEQRLEVAAFIQKRFPNNPQAVLEAVDKFDDIVRVLLSFGSAADVSSVCLQDVLRSVAQLPTVERSELRASLQRVAKVHGVTAHEQTILDALSAALDAESS